MSGHCSYIRSETWMRPFHNTSRHHSDKTKEKTRCIIPVLPLRFGTRIIICIFKSQIQFWISLFSLSLSSFLITQFLFSLYPIEREREKKRKRERERRRGTSSLSFSSSSWSFRGGRIIISKRRKAWRGNWKTNSNKTHRSLSLPPEKHATLFSPMLTNTFPSYFLLFHPTNPIELPLSAPLTPSPILLKTVKPNSYHFPFIPSFFLDFYYPNSNARVVFSKWIFRFLPLQRKLLTWLLKEALFRLWLCIFNRLLCLKTIPFRNRCRLNTRLRKGVLSLLVFLPLR